MKKPQPPVLTEHYYLDERFGTKNWFTAQTLIQRAVITAPTPARFIELGTHRGRSAAFTAVEIAKSGKQIHLTTLDIHPDLVLAAKENLSRFDNVVVVNADSTRYAAQVDDNSIDFIYIDADHSYEKLLADIDAWLPKMRIASVMAGDDYWWTNETGPIIDPNAPRFGMNALRDTFPVARAVQERFPEHELIVTQNWAKWWVVLA
jgi:predicted O-methyltransferase YrrM